MLLIVAVPLKNYAQDYEMGYCSYYDSYWGDWKYTTNFKIYGNYGGFIMYDKYSHPSQYFFKFEINSYLQPSKKEIKAHWKSKEPFVYYGTVEYYVSDFLPTIKDALKQSGRPCRGTGYRLKTASAEIRIRPYKKHPVCYNIFFDGAGFAISLGTAEFPK